MQLTPTLILLQCSRDIYHFQITDIKMENTDNITLTPEAAIAIKKLLKDQNMTGHSLRVFIAGVG